MTTGMTSTATSAGGLHTPYPLVNVDGGLEPAERAALSAYAHALSYGTGCFEGIRAFWNDDHGQLYLLEATAHYDRLRRSAHTLGLPLTFTTAELVTMTRDLLVANTVSGHAYLRPCSCSRGRPFHCGCTTSQSGSRWPSVRSAVTT